MEIYCVKCKEKPPTDNIKKRISKNGRNMINGTCSKCNSKKTCLLAK